MTMSPETLRGLLDEELEKAIQQIYARMLELEHESWALKDERERRREERRRRQIERDIRKGGVDDEDL